jgi:hypothetical protein
MPEVNEVSCNDTTFPVWDLTIFSEKIYSIQTEIKDYLDLLKSNNNKLEIANSWEAIANLMLAFRELETAEFRVLRAKKNILLLPY